MQSTVSPSTALQWAAKLSLSPASRPDGAVHSRGAAMHRAEVGAVAVVAGGTEVRAKVEECVVGPSP